MWNIIQSWIILVKYQNIPFMKLWQYDDDMTISITMVSRLFKCFDRGDPQSSTCPLLFTMILVCQWDRTSPNNLKIIWFFFTKCPTNTSVVSAAAGSPRRFAVRLVSDDQTVGQTDLSAAPPSGSELCMPTLRHAGITISVYWRIHLLFCTEQKGL